MLFKKERGGRMYHHKKLILHLRATEKKSKILQMMIAFKLQI